MIILDFASATTCNNDHAEVVKMIDGLHDVDTWKHEVVIKWQLFQDVYYQGQKLPELAHDVFLFAKEYAACKGYQTTASVFDKASLDFLLTTNPPFIKIAARPDVYPLMASIPYDMDIIVSAPSVEDHDLLVGRPCVKAVLCCVPDYPAVAAKYENYFSGLLHYGISDHTEDWYLYEKYTPNYYECHFKLEDSTGPDAQDFARTPEQLREIL